MARKRLTSRFLMFSGGMEMEEMDNGISKTD